MFNEKEIKLVIFFFSFSEEKKNQKEELFKSQWDFDLCGGRFKALP